MKPRLIATMIAITSALQANSGLLAPSSDCLAQIPSDTNLVVNGDFSLGDMGFETDYLTGSCWSSAVYAILDSYQVCHSRWWTGPDHTTGDGMYASFNGALDNRRVWSQTLAVSPACVYSLSFWYCSLYSQVPAVLSAEINGQAYPAVTLRSELGIWRNYSIAWAAGPAETAEVIIRDLNLLSFGNDFALDDIQMLTLSAAGAGALAISVRSETTNLPCTGATVTAMDAAGHPAASAQSLDGTALLGDLAPGTYRIQAKLDGRDSGIWQEVVVTTGAVTEATLRIASGTILAGRVIDSWNNRTIPGATVRLLKSGNDTGLAGQTDQAGNYCFELPDLGTYSVSVSKPFEFGGSVRGAYLPGNSGEVAVTTAETISFAPDLALQTRTVVFLHGINSNHGIWSDPDGDFSELLTEHGWLAIDDIDLAGACAEEGTWGCAGVRLQAAILEDELLLRLVRNGIQSFWVIAHSQGGLVARWMLERGTTEESAGSPFFASSVPGLITLGTPHHGSPLAADYLVVMGQICGLNCSNEWENLEPLEFLRRAWQEYPALPDLYPSNPVLRVLNRGVETQEDWIDGRCKNSIGGEVPLLTAAPGPRPAYASISSEISNFLYSGLDDFFGVKPSLSYEELKELSGCVLSDAVVPTWSSYLHAETENSNRAFNYVDTGPWHVDMTQDQGIQDFVAQYLLGAASSTWPASSPYPFDEVRKSTSPEWQRILTGSAFVPANSGVTDTLSVGVSDSLRIFWSAQVTSPRFALLTPTGAVIDSATAVTDPTMLLESFPDGSGSLRISTPAPGSWTLMLANADPVQDDRFAYFAAALDGIVFEVETATITTAERVVYAQILDEGGGVPVCTVTGSLSRPTGENSAVTFSDDGVDPDLQVGDGVFSAKVLLGPEYGSSFVRVNAAGDDTNPFRREVVVGLENMARVDVGLTSEGLVVDPGLSNAAAPVFLSATVVNRGTEPAEIETRFLLNTTMQMIAADSVVLASGDSVVVTAIHTPLWAGNLEYAVDMRILTDVIDIDYSDNQDMQGVLIADAFSGVDEGLLPRAPDLAAGRPVAVTGAFPNPFNPKVTIYYQNRSAGWLRVDVFDLRGRRVTTLAQGYHNAEAHQVVWDGKSEAGRLASSGLYFVRVKGPGGEDIRKILLVR